MTRPKREKMMALAILLNAVFLVILYSHDHTLRHQAKFTIRRILGYEEENAIYDKVMAEKEPIAIEFGPQLTDFLKHVDKDDFKDSEKREAMRIALIEHLLAVAKVQHAKGNEFPLLLKMDPVRAGIKILKKIGADLKDLQNQMEKVYEMCEGCLQEKYGKKTKHLPHVICIGAKKCGTGAFQNFLAHHPHLHKPPGLDEVHFFDNDKEYDKGIEYYHSLMPETSSGEVTYEKTPKYMVIPEVPERIYNMNSTVKLIAIVCNPVNRAFSDYTHVVKGIYRFLTKLPNPANWSGYFHSVMKKYQAEGDDSEEARLAGFEAFAKDYVQMSFDKHTKIGAAAWEGWIQNVHEEQVEASILTNGLYWVHLKNWIKAGFKREQMLILNGEELIANPAKVILRAQEFMGLEPIITNDNFVFDEDKGFYCFQKTGANNPSCLGDGKGRTRAGGGPQFTVDLKRKLYEFFAPYNNDLFQWIGEDFEWS